MKNGFLKKLGLGLALGASVGMIGTGASVLAAQPSAEVRAAESGFGEDLFRGLEDYFFADEEAEETAEDPETEPSAEITLGAADSSSGIQTAGQGGLTELSVKEVAANVMPSMVAITNTSVQEVENYFGGYGFPGSGNSQSYESVSMGTGVIVGETDEYLLIATNAHVVDGAKELSVAFVDEQAAEAEIVGTRSADDLAVIRVNKADLSADTLDAVSVIRIGSSADLAVGEQVVAIGNALGYGQSVSTGIVSALGRTIDLTEDSQIGLIQTDAAINPGNSGGALLNMYGELVGINSAKFADTDVEGMGYAIPITEALPILTELANGESGGTVQVREDGESDAYLGISCATISGEYASYYGIPEGVYVDSVEEGGAAEEAGLLPGDIITALDGVKITSVDALTEVLSSYAGGDTAEITVSRAVQQNSFFGRNEGGISWQSGTLSITFGSRNGNGSGSVMGEAA